MSCAGLFVPTWRANRLVRPGHGFDPTYKYSQDISDLTDSSETPNNFRHFHV